MGKPHGIAVHIAMHLNSRLLFERYARERFLPGVRVLEIGPDPIPSNYSEIVGSGPAEWHTLELVDGLNTTYVATGEYSFPIPDGRYDIVFSAQVMEHVREVWTWMAELARTCSPGGLVITINPVSWRYHEAPIDCWRAYPEAMMALSSYAGLDVELCVCECLEVPGNVRRRPGNSVRLRRWYQKLHYALNRITGARIECAFDTITIARKPRNKGDRVAASEPAT